MLDVCFRCHVLDSFWVMFHRVIGADLALLLCVMCDVMVYGVMFVAVVCSARRLADPQILAGHIPSIYGRDRFFYLGDDTDDHRFFYSSDERHHHPFFYLDYDEAKLALSFTPSLRWTMTPPSLRWAMTPSLRWTMTPSLHHFDG